MSKFSKKKKTIITITAVILLLSIIAGIWIFLKFNNTEKEKNTEQPKVREETVLNNDTIKDVKFEGDVIGYLTIESIGLDKAPIAEGTEMKTLNNYIGHFTDSAYLEGNVALAGHNRGYEKNYFENVKNIKEGDIVEYQTKSETKKYKVTEIKQIKETNVDVIKNTKENKITLITCVENKPSLRLCVVGEEIK